MSLKIVIFTMVASIILLMYFKNTDDADKQQNSTPTDSYFITDKICTEIAQEEYEIVYKKYGSDEANTRYNIVYRRCINNSQY